MRKFYLTSTLVLSLFFSQYTIAQDFSNKGKEFWLAYSYHVGMNGGGTPVMTLYLTSDVTTTYTVEIFGVAILQTGTINANQVIPVNVPNAYFVNVDGLMNGRAIHVTAVKPIVVYSFITRSQASAASLCLPTNVLGKEYYATSFTQQSNENNSNSFVTIVAIEDNTSVEITPTAATVGGWAANSTNTITLNRGQVYQVLASTFGLSGGDISGTHVRSVASAGGGCKRIAVFSGSGKINIGCNGSSDNLYQQLYPVASWGKKYLTVPSSARPNNYFRIMRNDPASNVYLNGALIPAGSFVNNYYQFFNNVPNLIESDLPVSVAQYFTTQNCAGNSGNYDPDMIVLNPVEQNINRVTLVSSPLTVAGTHLHNIHIIMRNGGTGQSSFRFDGNPIGLWNVHPQDNNYSYIYLPNITSGNHTLFSDSGFNALAYGYGNAETYGYSAGANVKDLYQQIGVSTEYGIEPTPSVCKGSPFRFKVSLPYCADSMRWDLSQLPGPPAAPPTQIYSTCTPGPGGPDSTTVVNGKTLYWYSLPSLYTFIVSGTFPVEIAVYAPNTDGCGNLQEIPFDLNVFDPPVADFNFVTPGCVAEVAQFTDNTTTPRPSYIWNWNFGDPGSGGANTSSLQNPTHIFSAPGTYTVTFSTITTPGCISSEITKQVIVNPIPTASITGTTSVCINAPEPLITFTAADGTAPYTFSYHINAGPAIHLPSPTATITVSVPTGTAGTFTYTLDSVKNTGSTLCKTTYTNTFAEVIVNANTGLALTAGSASQSLCVNNAIADIQYTISGGGNNATVTGLPPGVTGTYAAGVFTITGTPTLAGIYNYTVTATGLCLPNSLNGSITVNPDAAMSLTSGNNTQAVCINVTISMISYSITGGGTGATVSGLPPGVTGTYTGGVFSINGAPTATGTFNYTVNTTGTCLQTSATGTITVNPDATLNLTSGNNTQAVCQNVAITPITYTIAGGGTNGAVTGLPAGITGTYSAGVLTISGTPTTPGVYNFTVNTSGTCAQQSAIGSITVNPDADIDLTSAPASDAQELCVNSSIALITYQVSGGGTGATITGLPAGVTGSFSGGIFSITGTPIVSGTFNYTVTTNGTCVQTTATGTIIVNALPTPDFTVTNPSCETRELTFTDLSTPNSGALNGWAWTFGDAPTVFNGQNQTHTYAAAGTYNVTLTVTNDKGCVSNPILNRPITINDRPQSDFTVPEVCINDAATVFPDNSIGATTYFWNFGDPASGPLNTSNTQNGSHLYTAIGNYTVMHVAITAQGCTDTIYHDIFINAADPVSDFTITNPATLCSNDSVSLVNRSTISQGSVTKLEIYWDLVGAPGVFQTENVPVFNGVYKHKYPTLQTTQNYTVRMIAYSGNICFSNTTQVITVNAAPRVQFNNMPDACLDALPFQITQATEIGGVPGTGIFSGPGVTPGGIFNPASVGPGTYLIKYTFTSSAAGCVDTLTKPITVLDSASAQFTYSALACEKSTVDFNSSSSTIPVGVGTITGWNWNFGDPASGPLNTSASANPSHLFTSWGTYNVTLSVTTSNGCRSTVRSIPVFVNPIPRPNFTIPVSACLPSANVTFNNSSTIPDGTQATFSYLWDFDDPPSGILNSSTGSSPSHIYNTAGPFNVNLQVTSGAGCIHDTTIILNTIHPEPVGAFTVNKPDVCIGQSFTFTDNSNPADGTTTAWSWNLGNTDTRTIPSFTYTYGAAGTFTVTLFITNSHGCRSSTATRVVTVNPYPVVNAGPDLFILQDGSDTLEPIITAVNPTYLWTPNLYFIGSNTIRNPVVKGVEDITYTLTVTGQGDCIASDQVFIKVLKGPEIPNIFSPNGDGINDKWIIKYLDTYPGGTVEIFNRYGQMIFRSTGYGTPWDGTINGKEVPVGTYYYIVNPKNGRGIMSGYVDVIR